MQKTTTYWNPNEY